jgi:hypothetical protein
MIHVETIRKGKSSIICAGKQSELLDKLFNAPDEVEEFKGGRGTLKVITLSNCKAIQRHFQHGGILGNLLGDTFAGSSRSLSEFLLTLRARQRGAPVPKVLASITSRYCGLFYKGDIITEMLPSKTLTQVIRDEGVNDFRPLLKLLLDLHRSGLQHIDLNLNNILVPHDRKCTRFYHSPFV